MPWIRKIAAGWVAYYREGGREAPRQTIGPWPQKAQAKEAAAQLARQLAAKRKPVPGRAATFNQVLERYRASRIARGNDPMSLDLSLAQVRRMIETEGWESVAAITVTAVQGWKLGSRLWAARGKSRPGSPRVGAVLRAILRFASEAMDMQIDPRVLIALRPGKGARRPRRDLISDERAAEVQRKVDQISASAGAMVHCLLAYGWRPITAARLRVGDYDAAVAAITTSVKGGDTVRHPIMPETAARLDPLVQGRGAEEPLFIHPGTGRGWGLRGSIPHWLRAVGVKSYDLKRRSISIMLEQGMTAQTASLFTGHRTPGQVLRYARTNEERARAALTHIRAGLVSRGATEESTPQPGATDASRKSLVLHDNAPTNTGGNMA